jgi:hypothetical protein
MPNLLGSHRLDPGFFDYYIKEPVDYVAHEPHNFIKKPYHDFYIGFKAGGIYIKLFDNVQHDLVSFVRLEAEHYFGVEYKVIKLTYSRFPQQGHIRYIFSILLFDFSFYIMSDNLHTIPGSMNFWKKIKKLGNAEIRILNIVTRYNRRYGDQRDYLIWGLDEEYFVNGELNSLLVEDFWAKKVINAELYNYILENQKRIGNKENVRLTIHIPTIEM